MYGLVDCNNFFVSCERVFDPRLNGKKVVVLSNNDGCVIARSNEAKAAGIPMGCPAFKIKEYTDPREVIQLSGRHILYRDLSNRVMNIMGELVENLQQYSVDEAFFVLPHEDVETSHRAMADAVKRVKQYVGIPVSIGFAPTRTLAKIANHIAKRDRRITDGVYWLVRPEAIDIILRRTPIEDVWGIGRRLSAKLQARGIVTAADFVKMPPSLVRSQYSVTLERTQRELMGHDCQIANPVDITHKTIMTSRTFGKMLTDRDEVADAVVSFAERTARQLRAENSVAGAIMTYVRGDHFRQDVPFYSNSCQLTLDTPASDTMTIVRMALMALNNIWRDGFGYRKAGVMALDVQHGGGIQLNVFDPEDHGKLRRLMTSIDSINNMYGTRSVKLAPGIQRGQWASNQSHQGTLSKTLHFYIGMVHKFNTTAPPGTVSKPTAPSTEEQEPEE
ncbi:MAG: SOS mutagenesis and repair protein UmuC [Muribaculaceae bacterium]|nr:SOS mutagenesis and repair protein UmuC [Muribaculaceae bacterium]